MASARGGLTPPRAASVKQSTTQDLAPVAIEQLPIHLFPSKKSYNLIEIGATVLPAQGQSATIVSFKVPNGVNAIIRWLGNQFIGAGLVDGTGLVLWALMIGNSAARGLEAIPGQIGTVAIPSEIAPVRAKEGRVVSLVGTNVGLGVPAGQILTGRIGGWFYPKDEEQQGAWYD